MTGGKEGGRDKDRRGAALPPPGQKERILPRNITIKK
jgi:hypothetical protein